MIDFKAKLFFDRKAVTDAIGKVSASNLGKEGAIVRRTAQQSMAYRAGPASKKSPPSAPHTPPRARRKSGAKLRKHLYYAFEPSSKGVIVGPEKLPGGTGDSVPQTEEFGATVQRKVIVREVRRKAHSKAQADAYRRKILSGAIVPAKAPVKTVTAKYPDRAFMGPSLKKAVASGQVASVWQNSVKG